MRRNPDRILKQIHREETEQARASGKLKIFFGYAAGVGKTYSMLKAAHDALEQGEGYGHWVYRASYQAGDDGFSERTRDRTSERN